ncbi:FAD-dependent oxidoreductase [Priestia megaterium]|nr:FAD-dependent oxidoreductase [Priestia megaterium]
MTDIPKHPEPMWRDTVKFPSFKPLAENRKVDVVVVGGGITGVTTAYLLQKEGLQVALLEASNILNGTTGHTTAKITAQHDVIYDELLSHIGEEKTSLYYQANEQALQFMKNLIEQEKIDCDFSIQDAYLYASTLEFDHRIHKEFRAYQKLNIPCTFETSLPFQFDVRAAAVMKDQAQFHPLKYLTHLVNKFVQAGGFIFENTVATDVEESNSPTVVTRDGHRISCQYIAICSHFPFYDGAGFYFTRMYADRSYVLAAKVDKPFPGGMYLSADQPTRSLRSATINGEEVVLVGGEGHKTGQGINTKFHYQALQRFAEENFNVTAYPYRWSAQDLFTLDKIPYIGPIKKNKTNIFIATGFKKWGMSHSAVAAQLIADSILQQDNPFKDLYDPSRFYADPSIKHFLRQNLDVANHLIKGKLDLPEKGIDQLENDEGAIIYINSKRTGAYKDTDGNIHCVDTTCTHLGCEVNWNVGDRTWDCPCHGSRYSYDGSVVEGPAENPLAIVDLKLNDEKGTQ